MMAQSRVQGLQRFVVVQQTYYYQDTPDVYGCYVGDIRWEFGFNICNVEVSTMGVNQSLRSHLSSQYILNVTIHHAPLLGRGQRRHSVWLREQQLQRAVVT